MLGVAGERVVLVPVQDLVVDLGAVAAGVDARDVKGGRGDLDAGDIDFVFLLVGELLAAHENG